MAVPTELFGGSAVWAIGGLGIFGIVVALAKLLTSVPGLAGEIGSEEKAARRQERLERFGLREEENEFADIKTAIGDARQEAEGAEGEASEDTQAEREEAEGKEKTAEATEKKAAKASKKEANISKKVLRAMEDMLIKMRKERKALQKEIKTATNEGQTATAAGQTGEASRVRQILQTKQMKIASKLRQIQYLTRLIQQQKQGLQVIEISGRTRQAITKELKAGMRQQAEVSEQRLAQAEQRRARTEQQEAQSLGQFMQLEESEVQQEQRGLQSEQAEDARLKQEEQVAKVINNLDKTIGKELKEIRNLTNDIFETESKNTNIRSVLKSDAINAARDVFADTANAINDYNRQKKTGSVAVKMEVLHRLSAWLSDAMRAATAENQAIRTELGNLPENKTKEVIFRDLNAIYNKIQIILGQVRRTLEELQRLEQ